LVSKLGKLVALVDIQVEHLDRRLEVAELDYKLVEVVELGYRLVER